MRNRRQGPPAFFTMLGAVTASALLLIIALLFWLFILALLGTVAYAAWQAIVTRDASVMWALPLGALMMAGQLLPGLPGYVWIGLALVLWLEWRLARLEAAIYDVARAVGRLAKPRRRAEPEDDDTFEDVP